MYTARMSIKIGLIGECGVGKTTLAEFLQSPLEDWVQSNKMQKYQPYVPTVGCNIQVLLMPLRQKGGREDIKPLGHVVIDTSASAAANLDSIPGAVTVGVNFEDKYSSTASNSNSSRTSVGEESEIVVELWDVGGNPRFASSRSMFYNSCDGFIFVWDASSEATYNALDHWLTEVVKSRATQLTQSAYSGSNSSSSSHVSIGNAIPSNKSIGLGLGLGSERLPSLFFQVGATPLRMRVQSGSGLEIHTSYAGGPDPCLNQYLTHGVPDKSSSSSSISRHTQQFYFSPLRSHVRMGAASTYVTGGGLGLWPINPTPSVDIEAGMGSKIGSISSDVIEVLDIPLIIVGNKADRLGAKEYAELVETCSQHTFISTRTTDSAMSDSSPLRAFFEKCYERKRRLGEGNLTTAHLSKSGTGSR